MSDALHTGQYFDLQTVPINLDPEHKPRDAEEGFLRALIFNFGFNRYAAVDTEFAKKQAAPFIESDPFSRA